MTSSFSLVENDSKRNIFTPIGKDHIPAHHTAGAKLSPYSS